MKQIKYIVSCLMILTITSCVSTKKFKGKENELAALQTKYNQLQTDIAACNDDKANLNRQKASLENDIANLNKQIDFLKQNNTQALRQLQDLSVISASQAESIKKSLENMGAKDAYIQTLQQQMAHKDSLNMVLVMNLKGAVGNMDDKDINIKVDKGVVYIDISDKLLFKSGKYEITKEAKEVLGKVAAVLKNQPDMEFMVEGHTDNIAYKNPVLLDNWDLSVKRATSVVRILQKDYGLDPAKMAAAGRGEYKPLADNSTEEGRAANRRTRIVILPQLDQFFKLLEPKQ
ncbi:MAG: OmpA family protein [Sphingobacteriales bacterium]|nr:OmpA family protein [Sphingobacteriales bacterium]